MTFSKEALISRQLNWNLANWDAQNKADTQNIIAAAKANGNIYFYLNNVRDPAKPIRLNTIKIVQPSKELMLVINTEESFADTISARNYIKQDIDKKYGMVLYSENEIHQLQKQKSIDTMTVKDFKMYVTKMLHFRIEMDSLSKLPGSPDGLIYYGYSMMRNIIGQLGYNPLIANDAYNKFILRFKNDPETKKITEQLFK